MSRIRSTASSPGPRASRPDKLLYRFLLQAGGAASPTATRLTAADVAFSLTTLKEKAHPTYSQLLGRGRERRGRKATTSSPCASSRTVARDAHLVVVGMPIFSAAWWKGRDFDAATLLGAAARLRPLPGEDLRAGPVHRVRAARRLLGQGPAGQPGDEQLPPLALRVLSRAAGRLRGVQGRRDQLPPGVHLARVGDRLRLPRAQGRAGEEGSGAERRADRLAGLVLQHQARRRSRTRACVRRSAWAFDFEWTNKNVMFSLYKRVVSYFQNSAMEAVGPPGPKPTP